MTKHDTRFLLKEYYKILEEKKYAKYVQSKYIPVEFKKTFSAKELWEIHDDALKKRNLSEAVPAQSLLDIKIELASRIYRECCFCERKCGVDRTKVSGKCKVEKSLIASEFLHIGEEYVLIPSHTIFFSGCTFNCVFCQNWDISQQNCGVQVEPKKLALIIHNRKLQGSKNVNWVGGDPTPNLFYIFQVLKICNDNIPQIWNSNMFCSLETMKLLDGIIDIYLTDFKYGNNYCALRLSKIENYFDIVKRNHKKAYDNGEVIVRQLVMPNHIDCCSRPIFEFISNNTPDVLVNIMDQYRPEYKAIEYQDIARSITLDEIIQTKKYADRLNIHQI